MGFLDKAKASLKDVQNLADDFKNSIISDDASSATQSTAAPTPASSVAAPSAKEGGLNVPRSTAPGAPAKIPLAERKRIRDDFEDKKPELEAGISKILGEKWTIHVDTAGVYSYIQTDNAGRTANPGVLIYDYFRGALFNLTQFAEKFGAAEAGTINQYAPTHTITLEPTEDPKVSYVDTDFHEGRWRILFRDVKFGTNSSSAGENLAAAVNAASKGASSTGGGQPELSLIAKKSVRDGYEAKVSNVLTKARQYLDAPDLTFVPNFETNYATLLAFGANGGNVRKDWENTLGPATLSYFEGFTSQLDWQKFKGDDMMQEGFKEAVSTLKVSFLVSTDVTRSRNDCVIENDTLIIRTKPDAWWGNVNDATEKMSTLL